MAIGKEDRNRHIEISADQVMDSIKLSMEKSVVKTFVLKGPRDEINLLDSVALLRAIPGEDKTEFMLLTISETEDENLTVDQMCKQIMEMEVPYSLRNGNSTPNNKPLLNQVSESLGKKDEVQHLCGLCQGINARLEKCPNSPKPFPDEGTIFSRLTK